MGEYSEKDETYQTHIITQQPPSFFSIPIPKKSYTIPLVFPKVGVDDARDLERRSG
jgi:hypothetical protein